MMDALGVHDQHHDVGGLTTDLEADARASDRVEGQGAHLAVGLSAGGDAVAAFAPADERSLVKGRKDENPIVLREKLLRDALVGGLRELVENQNGVAERGLVLLSQR